MSNPATARAIDLPGTAGLSGCIAGEEPASGLLALVVVPPAQGGWEMLVPFVEALATDRRVVAVGLRTHDPGAITLDGDVSDVLAACDALGLHRFDLFGASYGGLVALALAARRPERVAALVLHGTCARLVDHGRAVALGRRIPWRLLHAQLVHLYTGWTCAAELGALGLRSALRLARRARRHRTPAAALARRIELFCDADLEAALPRIACPVSVLHGDLDRTVGPRSVQRLLAALPGAASVELGGSGHLAVITEPDRLASVVRGRLAGAVAMGLVEPHVASHP